MRTYSTQFKVEQSHINQGDHADWREQLLMAENLHFALRENLGLGLEELKEKHGLFLVMGIIENVRYRKQLRLGDMIDARINVVFFSLSSLRFQCSFYKEGLVLATEMKWVMPLICLETGRSIRIPDWMRDIVDGRVPV